MNRSEFLRLLALVGAGSVLMPPHMKAGILGDDFTSRLFGDGFLWGVSTASYQIEGGWNEDGKGESIWDRFSHQRGKIDRNENGDVSCDFYHHYNDDLALLQSLNFRNFRFSLSWPRILPNGTGSLNVKGIDFYKRLTDSCLEKGITPWITLYHWDLPQVLEEKGGWTNRDIIQWFAEYADVCTRHLGDKVKNWIVLNEPLTFTSVGYMLGMHAPGHRGLGHFMPAVHHAAMAQAEGGRMIRQNVPGAFIGNALSCSYIQPAKDNERDQRAAAKIDALMNRLFLEPAMGLSYPWDGLPLLTRLQKYMKDGDEQKLKFDFDFIGLQNYFRVVGKSSLYPPLVWAKQVNPRKLDHPLTEMGWEVYPQGIYEVLKRFSKYPIKNIYITENGACFEDKLVNGRVHDVERLAYFKEYLGQVFKAKKEGVNVKGYFLWTFLDNFEWAEGYRPRFGIVYTDFQTQQRLVKDSGLWFQQFLKDSGSF